MNIPKLVLFDYGHTLVYEKYFNTTEGAKVIYEHISQSNIHVDRDEFIKTADILYEELSHARRELALEVPAQSFTRLLRDYFGICFDIDEGRLQEIYWDAVSPPVAMDGVGSMLKLLKELNVKTAVISNLWYCEEVLKRRLERTLPESNFEFYMSTCDYGFRKPNKILFDIALKRAGTEQSETWFCGDEPIADIEGAYNAGILPVWFDSKINCPYKFRPQGKPLVECIHINSWEEFEKLIRKCKRIHE